MSFPFRKFFRVSTIVIALLSASSEARAGQLVFGIESTTLTPDSTGGFDVVLTNNGPGVAIGGFAFELTTSSPGVSFTAVDGFTSTTPYIFASDSFFGPAFIDITSAPGLPGILVAASDSSLQILDSPPSGYLLASGSSIGLGRVYFSTDGNASGTLSVTFDFPDTNLSDPQGNLISLGSTAVPEASGLVLAGEAVLLVGAMYLSHSRRRLLALWV
jgi:hypothetical protein